MICMFKLTKRQQSEFRRLKKSLDLSIDEYTKYYELLSKANAKTARMRRNGTAVYAPKFSKASPNRFASKADFYKQIDTFKWVLDPRFRREENAERRETFMQNIESLVGGGEKGRRVLEAFRGMSDSEILSFIQSNRDIGALAYGSPDVVKDFLDENADTLASRLDEGY